MSRATVDASTVLLGYADTPADPFKDIVCEADSNANLDRNIISETTKCGTVKTPGQQNNTFSGNFTVVTDQASDEASHDEIMDIYMRGVKKYWRWTNVAGDVFVGGYGYVKTYNPQAPSEGAVTASITVEIDGDIDMSIGSA